MKNLKKLASLLLALVMVLSLATVAFAATGDTGSITIENADHVTVEGKTFNAYRILDLQLVGTDDPKTEADERGYVYTVPSELVDFYSEEFNIATTVGDFDAQVVDKIMNHSDLFAFATKALQAAKDANLTAYSATGKGETENAPADTQVTINNLPLGYYVVEDAGTATPISALMLQSTNETVTINIKADKPSVEKTLGDTKEVVGNSRIGDTVPYTVTSKVPDMTGYKTYTEAEKMMVK